MRTLRKALSLSLVVVMLLLDVPAVAFAADEPVYEPSYNEYPVFSARASTNLDQFLGADGNSAFNIVGRFEKAYALGGGYPDRLAFSSLLTGNDYGYYQMGFSELEKRIAAANELGVALHAQITNDKHWSVYHLFSTETSANILKLSSGLYSHHAKFGQVLHSYDSIEHASSGTYAYADAGGDAFPSTGADPWQIQGLTLEHRISGDTCGAPSTGNIAVMLADVGEPEVQSIYTTAGPDPSSAKHEKFKAGETIYVHLKFDEPIRLSTDNAADLAGLTLNMAINDTKTGAQVGGTLVAANIVSLIGDTLTFKCVVPESLDILGQPVTTNHYLSSVTINNQSWVTADPEAFDLIYIYKDGTGKHSIAPKDPANNPNLVKTSSLITDFAGNPVARSDTPIYFSKPCYMDNVAPTVVSVTPVAVEKNPNSDFTGTGQTFMTAGDKIEITAEFSEEMQFYNEATGIYGDIATNDPIDPGYGAYRVGYLKAELNLKDDKGDRIVVTGTRAVTASAGVNGIKVTRVTFELTVPVGASPVVGEEAYPLGIYQITSTAPNPLCDSRGNQYKSTSLLGTGPIITRQLWLDTRPPTGTGAFIGSDEIPEFYIQVAVDDPTGGAESASGSTGMFGKFEWVNGDAGNQDYVYEYAYMSSPEVDESSRTYMQATEDQPVAGLVQLPGDGLYIHIKLMPGQEYSIVGSTLKVEMVDRAGNTREMAISLPYEFDNVGPVVTEDSRANVFDIDHGDIETSIRVKDIVGKVSDIEYQWVEWTGDVAPDAGSTWHSASYTGGSGSLYKTFDASATDLGLDEMHKYSLFVRTLDTDGEELPGRARFDFKYDLRKPEHNLEFVTSPDGYHAKHSVLFTPGPQKTVEINGETVTRTPTTIAMIKIPGETGKYYVKSALLPGGSGAVSAYDDIFDIPHAGGLEASVFEDWHLATMTGGGTEDSVITSVYNLYSSRGPSDTTLPDIHRALHDLMNTYYGELNLRLIAAYEQELIVDAAQGTLTIPRTALVADYEYVLKSAYAGIIDDDDCAYRFEVAPLLDDDGNKEGLNPYEGGKTVLGKSMNVAPPTDLNEGMFGSVQSLDGVKIEVKLKNLKMPEWGTADLAGIDVEILRTTHVYNAGIDKWQFHQEPSPIYTTRLPAVASQVFEIPAGVCNESGLYNIKMSVQSLAEGAGSGTSRISRELFGYVEKATVGSYGVVKTTTTISSEDAGGAPVQIEYGYSLGSSPALEVYLGESGDTSLTFRAEFVPTRYPAVHAQAGDNFFTRIYMRLTNGSNGAQTGWVRMSAAARDGEPSVGDWEPYGYGEVTFDAADLSPLGLQDRDELVYEVMTTTGVAAIEWNSDTQKAVTTHEPYTPPAQSVIVRMSDKPPVLEMQLEPLTPVKSTAGVIATVKSLTSPSSPVDTVVLKYKKGAAGALTPFAIDDSITITENGTYYFFAYDRFGNVSVVEKVVDWIDDDAPILGVMDHSSGNQFDFEVTLDDASPVSLALQHEEDYWENVLGMADVATQDDVPKIVVSDSGAEGMWYASAPNETGVYQVETTIDGDTKTARVHLKGVFKYDPDAGAIAARSITLIATDAAGNESREIRALPAAANTPVKCSGNALDTGGVKLTFNAPVKLTSPALSPADTTYSLEKAAVPIFASGTCDIEYADIFGEIYQESVTVNAYGGSHEVDVTVSETGPTRNDVVITIDATGNPAATLELPTPDATMTVVPVTVDSKVKRATITVTSNRSVVFGVKADTTQTRTIPITNIDRTPPTATVAWAFTDAVVVNPATGMGETKGEVVASLVASESIIGAKNKATTHRFTFGDQDDYVLEYQDDAGNPGAPVTVSLSSTTAGAIEIVEKTFIDADGDAPAYSMAVSQAMPGGAFVKTAQYTQAEYAAELGLGNPFDRPHHVTMAMRLQFSVMDVNSTRLFVLQGLTPDTTGLGYENPAVGAIAGVSWSGNTVDLTDNVEICVVIVDAKDNMTLIPVKTTKIDNVPPTGEIRLVKVDFYRTRAYLVNLWDALSATVTVRSKPGVSWDPVYGGGVGAYYHEFLGNGEFEFTIEDSAGNTATVTAMVSGIDVMPPAVSKVTWSPSFIGPDGKPVSTAPPEDRKLSTNVVARVEFSKPLLTDSCTATLQSPDGVAADYFECTWGSTNATVTFKAAAIVKLDFVAQNYVTGTYTLDGSGLRIDRIPPYVTVTSDEPLSGSTRSVRLTITSNEPAWEVGSGLAMTAENKLTVTLNITKNGEYAYRFADEVGNIADTFTFVDSAGNSTVGATSISVSHIDGTAPDLSVSGFPSTRAEILQWNSTHGPEEQKTHTMRNTSFNVNVTTDEPATIAMGDEVKSGTSATFSIGTNGRYTIRATDAVGNTTTKSFTVDCIDRTPPTIVLGAGTLKIKQGTTEAALGDVLADEISDGRVYAVDNIDQDVTPVVSKSLTEANLNTPGAYVIEYTATDDAGNTTSPPATRTVLVYDLNAPTIFIQGIKTESRGATIVNAAGKDTVLLSASMPDPGGGHPKEPFKLYYGIGYRTIGEMKSLGKRLAVRANADPLLGDADLPVPSSGFYTLYLVTQSRTEYITYVYVQK
ncbi:MAG: immunoglobulin-like domain-containing protein [Bacillota bacterium]